MQETSSPFQLWLSIVSCVCSNSCALIDPRLGSTGLRQRCRSASYDDRSSRPSTKYTYTLWKISVELIDRSHKIPASLSEQASANSFEGWVRSAAWRSRLQSSKPNSIKGYGSVYLDRMLRRYAQGALTLYSTESWHNWGPVQKIQKIRRSATVIAHLPPDLQRAARDSYAKSIHKVFLLAVCAAIMAYIVRLPVSDVRYIDIGIQCADLCVDT